MIGQTISHFRVTGMLGRGGMGVVYAAEDLNLGRRVALKVLPDLAAANPIALQRFHREAHAASILNHPNICTIYEIAEHEGSRLLAMELLEGQSLRQRLAAGPLPIGLLLNLAVQIVEALAFAHAKGVLHRDIKSANIFLTASAQAKLLDFGLAKVFQPVPGPEDPTAEQFTVPGTAMGTLAYMPPEQVLGRQTDARSDLYSVGVVFFEMATGKLPFQRDSNGSLVDAILHHPPSSATHTNPEVPVGLARMINKCLEKEPAKRYQTAGDLLLDLKKLDRPIFTASHPRYLSSALVAVVVLLFGSGAWLFRRNAEIRWATGTALPEIMRLAEKDDNFAAFALERRAEPHLSRDTLAGLLPQVSRIVSIETTPSGADIYRKPYGALQAEWQYLGRTPIRGLRIARGYSRWKIVLAGYETLEFGGNNADSSPGFPPPETMKVSLCRPGEKPEGMLRVSGGATSLQIPGLEGLPPVTIPDYYIGRNEVTNRQYKEFVDGGGYTKPEFWKQQFVKDGRALTFAQALESLRDKTGRPGPSTWELSDFAAGQADLPVSGVSWYEASAYAEFRRQRLPTAYEWSNAAGTRMSPWIVILSNFAGKSLLQAGSSQAISPSGAADMAGNVKEWCWNVSGTGHLILGGGYNEPAYMFNDWDAKPSFERNPGFGFRLAQSVPGLDSPAAALAQVPTAFRDYRREKPVSDSIFAIYKSLYAYDKTPLNAGLEATEESDHWRRERISYHAGYGTERMFAYVYIPKRGNPPFQTVVVFPGASALYRNSSQNLSQSFEFRRFEYLIKSRRALVFPIYKGTYDRHDELQSDHPTASALYRDHVIMWSKELRRTIDYIETRKDLDAGKIAYYGFSWGGTLGAILPALEDRIKVLVLESGGLFSERTLPEVDQLNFAPRVKVPVLMLNAHYDHYFPMETSQIPLLHFFGAPEMDKRHIVAESWHAISPYIAIKEGLAWLDHYLGPVE